MKISVIISTYKRPDELKKAIRSLKQQIRKPDEIIVVASKGDKNTEKILKKIRGIKYFIIEATNVLPKENKGIKESDGDIICFIDDDVTVQEKWLSKIEKIFQAKRNEIGAVGGPCIPVINGKPIIKTISYPPYITFYGRVIGSADKLPAKAGYAAHIRGCNMCFRKDLLDYFDENLMGDGSRFETDASLRILRKGYKIWYDPKVYVYHHLAPRRKVDRNMNREMMFWFNYNNTYVLLKNLKGVQRILFLIYTFLIGDYMSRGLVYIIGGAIRKKNPIILWDVIPIFAGKIQGIKQFLKAKLKG